MSKELKISNCFSVFLVLRFVPVTLWFCLLQTGRLCVSRAEETEGTCSRCNWAGNCEDEFDSCFNGPVGNESEFKFITYRPFLSVLLAVRLLQDCEKRFFRIVLLVRSGRNDGMRSFIECQVKAMILLFLVAGHRSSSYSEFCFALLGIFPFDDQSWYGQDNDYT